MKNLMYGVARAKKDAIKMGDPFYTEIEGEKYKINVYELHFNHCVLKFWNTQNNAGIYNWETLKDGTLNYLEDGCESGNDISDDMNYWEFETEEIGEGLDFEDEYEDEGEDEDN